MKLLLMMMKVLTLFAPSWQLGMQDQLTRLVQLLIHLYFLHNNFILQDHVKVIRISIKTISLSYKIQSTIREAAYK